MFTRKENIVCSEKYGRICSASLLKATHATAHGTFINHEKSLPQVRMIFFLLRSKMKTVPSCLRKNKMHVRYKVASLNVLLAIDARRIRIPNRYFQVRPVAKPKSQRVSTNSFAMKSTRQGSNYGEFLYPKYIGCKAKRQRVQRVVQCTRLVTGWIQHNFGRALLLPSKEKNINAWALRYSITSGARCWCHLGRKISIAWALRYSITSGARC